jgi:MFS family permease
MNRSPRSNVRRLAIGRLISVTGGAAAYTALMFGIWNGTKSAAWQSFALLLTFGVTGLLSPLTGHLGDRFDRRKVMVWSEALAAVFYAVMAAVHAPLPLILLAFGSAVTESPFWSSSAAAIPNLVETADDISWANGLVGVGRNAGIMVGPMIGGVLVAVIGTSGPSWVFGLNALTFVVSILLTLSVHANFAGERTEAEEEEHRGISAGVRFLWNDRVIRRMVLAWLVFLLGAGMGMVADAPLADHFGAGPVGFGLLITCWGGGSVLGSLLGRKLTVRTEPLWLVLGAAGIAVGHFGVGTAPVFVAVLVFGLIMGTSDGLTIVAEQGIMQRRTPDAVRSRVMGAFEAVLSLGLAVAYVFAGPVLNALGAQGVYLIGGVTATAATLMLLPLLRLKNQLAAGAPSDVTPIQQVGVQA